MKINNLFFQEYRAISIFTPPGNLCCGNQNK